MKNTAFVHDLMHPRAIAIVGASNNPMKMGTMHALSILKDGFAGNLYPIHPTEETVLGQKAYGSPHDLPETPDLAIFVLPAKYLPGYLEDFGKIGTRSAIIITAGFKETGADGAEAEQQIIDIANRYGMRFIGPNCMGILNRAISLNTTVTPVHGPPGPLGLISQSGTYVAQTIAYLEKRGIHFSKAISVGNEANVNLIDILEYLGEDPETRAIALYIESIRDVPRFLEAASRITPTKPIVAQYVGGSEAGARAGASHTGAMAGQDHLYDGLFKQAGVMRVYSVEDLYGMGWALANQPVPKGNRIGIITNSGGPGSAIADTLEAIGCEVPAFSETLKSRLRPLVAAHAPCGNPVDLTFAMDMPLMTEKLPEILMESGEIDGLVLHGAMSHGFLTAIYPNLKDILSGMSLAEFLGQSDRDLSQMVRKPFDHQMPMTVSSFFDREDNFTRAYEDAGIPVYDSPEKAARAMGALVTYGRIRDAVPNGTPPLPEKNKTAAGIIRDARNKGQSNLDEFAAKRFLAAYGIPVPEERLVETEAEALTAAEAIGFPVAVKGCHPDFLHKTEAGLVHLGIKDAEGVGRAFTAIQTAAGRPIPVIIGQMISGRREFLAGITFDAQFGHCVAFGLGGIFTEAFADVTYRVAPIGEACAQNMITDIRNRKLLGPYRGMPAVNAAGMAGLLQQISLIPSIHPEIKEIDINPLLISHSNPVAVDALIVLK